MPVRILEAGGDRTSLAELVDQRELLGLLVARDLSVRYSQTALGIAWVLAQPIAVAVVFSVFLAGFAAVSTDGIPSQVFYLAGLVPWTFFASAVTRATGSIAENERLVTRVYFPRLFLPTAAVVSSAVDALLGFAALIVVVVASGAPPELRWLVAIPFFAFLVVVAFALGLVLAAMNARFRDVRHAVPFALQLGLFASPIAYPLSVVPPSIRPFASINPLAPIVEGIRWSFTGRGTIDATSLLVAAFVTLALLVVGLRTFASVERTIADVV